MTIQNDNLKENVQKLLDRSMINWSDHEKIDYLSYCLGVLKRDITNTGLELMEKEFNSYDQKYNGQWG